MHAGAKRQRLPRSDHRPASVQPAGYAIAEDLGGVTLAVPSSIGVNSPLVKQAAKACKSITSISPAPAQSCSPGVDQTGSVGVLYVGVTCRSPQPRLMVHLRAQGTDHGRRCHRRGSDRQVRLFVADCSQLFIDWRVEGGQVRGLHAQNGVPNFADRSSEVGGIQLGTFTGLQSAEEACRYLLPGGAALHRPPKRRSCGSSRSHFACGRTLPPGSPIRSAHRPAARPGTP